MKTKKLLLCTMLLLLAGITSYGQELVVQDNTGLGKSIAMAKSRVTGNDIIAVGGSNSAENPKGYVAVYENVDGVWTQLGDNIEGENTLENYQSFSNPGWFDEGDLSGSSISLSEDGTVLAIGSHWSAGSDDWLNEYQETGYVRVYKYKDGAWGLMRNGEFIGDTYSNFGHSVSLSGDGLTLAVGAYSYDDVLETVTEDVDGRTFTYTTENIGHVQVYVYNPALDNLGGWVVNPVEIEGDNTRETTTGYQDFFGKTVALSKDGNTLAVFADALIDDGTTTTSRAFVEVYKRDGYISKVNITNAWDKKYVIRTVDAGETTGQGALDASNLSLSNDGSMLAVGYPTDSDNATTSGFVNVYKLNDTSWEKMATIEGINDSDFFGHSVALSGSGSLLAVGTKQSVSNAGYAAIYNENTDGTWTQVYKFDGTENGDLTGWSVAMSADGTLMAVGSPGGSKAEVSDISTNSITVDDNIDNLGDYTEHKVTFSFEGVILGAFNEDHINLTNAQIAGSLESVNGVDYTVIIKPTPTSITPTEPFITITLADEFRENNPQFTETSFSYVYMPDANFRGALATHSTIIDTNKDNIISYEEVASYATYGVNCAGKGITDLTGIGAFSNMSGEFRFNANALTSVDLSNNLKINYLELSDNKLRSIDVSMLPDLNKFYIDGNKLETLDVTSNKKMLYLHIANNPLLKSVDIDCPIMLSIWCFNNDVLKNLDLSRTNIETVNIYDNLILESVNLAVDKNGSDIDDHLFSHNDIDYFDMHNNPMLTCLQLIFDSANINLDPNSDDYDTRGVNVGLDTNSNYGSNSLRGQALIDEYNAEEVSCLVQFADDNFEEAMVLNTLINTDDTDGGISYAEAAAFAGIIDVGGLDIEDMTGLDAFVNIIGLACDNNDLENLDVSYNTALISLSCFENNLVELDLSHNIALTSLICYENNLTSLNVANGNNENITGFFATENSNLTCIQVDDADYSTTNWTNIDDTASFSIDGNCESLSVNTELITDAIRVSPNPVTNTLNIITASGIELKQAKLYSIVGKELVSTTSSELDASSLPSGMYILKIESTDGEIQTKKIIKK